MNDPGPTGSETSRSDRCPELDAVERSLASLTGEYLQMPPAYSAKKVAGTRAYELARRDEPVALTAVPVKVARVELRSFDGRTAHVGLTGSAGFYRSRRRASGQKMGQ